MRPSVLPWQRARCRRVRDKGFETQVCNLALPEIIAEESIITSDGKRLVKVPIRTLEEYRFRFDPYDGEKVGQGDGNTKEGDVIGRRPGGRSGSGSGQAGGQPGVDYYEAEITVDELAELIFEDLGLPHLRPKAEQELPTEAVRFTDIRKKGPLANLDKRRSILESIRRRAREEGEAEYEGLTEDDLRFRVWEQEWRRQTSAVVIAMRDASGSMGEYKKYLTRSMCFWMLRFLRTKYQNVEIVFLVHHMEAQEVDEEAFFHLGESGGTKVSSAYELCQQVIEERYPPERWNIYPFHFSDGESCNTDGMKNTPCGGRGEEAALNAGARPPRPGPYPCRPSTGLVLTRTAPHPGRRLIRPDPHPGRRLIRADPHPGRPRHRLPSMRPCAR